MHVLLAAALNVWLIGGRLDRDGANELTIPPGPPTIRPVPRIAVPRTTSTPGVIAPGYLVLRAEGTNVQLKAAP